MFNIVVEKGGIYPVRLLWFEGGGGANVEFFSVVDGEKILINDSSNPNAIKACREGPERFYIRDASPVDGFRGLVRTLDFEIVDGDVNLVGRSVKLEVDGVKASPAATKSGDVTAITLDPGALFRSGPHTVVLSYDEASDPVKTRTSGFSFIVPGGQIPVLEDNPTRYFRFNEIAGNKTLSETTIADNFDLFSAAEVSNGADLSVAGLIKNDPNSSGIRLDGTRNQFVLVTNGDDINQNAGPWPRKTVEVWFKPERLPRVNEDGTVQAIGIFEEGRGDRAVSFYLFGTQNSADPTEANLV